MSFRFRDGSQDNGVPVGEAVERIVAHVQRRINEEPTAAAIEDPRAAAETAGVGQ